MKRITAIILALILALGIAGCTNTKKQDALLEYINEDLAELGEMETKAIASYESVTGENYTSDLETYTEVSENTIILVRQLNEEAVDVAGRIDDEEILACHKLYMNGCSKFLAALGVLLMSLETGDYAQLSAGNELLNESNNYMLDFRTELQRLAKKYNVELYNYN